MDSATKTSGLPDAYSKLLSNRRTCLEAEQNGDTSAAALTPTRAEETYWVLYQDKSALSATRETWKDLVIYYNRVLLIKLCSELTHSCNIYLVTAQHAVDDCRGGEGIADLPGP